MNYTDFINKWANRNLYNEGLSKTYSGKIQMWKDQKINVLYGEILADVYYTPKWHGWESDKQRRDFYKDAKSCGVRKMQGKKNEWYKVKDILSF